MERRIELESRGRKPENVKKLNLNYCKSTEISSLTDEYCNLVSLSLIHVGLTTLKGFPKLPNLRKLYLNDNYISGDLNLLLDSPKLTLLSLCDNKIMDVETLLPLAELKNLKDLYLYNCEVENVQNYRDKIFGFISSLKCLDGFDRNAKVNEDSQAKYSEVDGDSEDESSEVDEDSEDESSEDEDSENESSEDEDSENESSEDEDSENSEVDEESEVIEKDEEVLLPSRMSWSTEEVNPCISTTRTTRFTAIANNTSGTAISYDPLIVDDTTKKGGKWICIKAIIHPITAVEEYESKSFEELRVEDYAANRKGPTPFARATEHTSFVDCFPAAVTATQSEPLDCTVGRANIVSLQKNFKELLLSGDDHDVIIKIKNQEYKAHKCVLRARSPVFSAMFKYKMKENDDNSISIDDCDAEDFSKFLQYIYTGEVENLSPSSAMNLYYAGDKYQISVLKEMCCKFLKCTLSAASICGTITLAAKHNETDLLQYAISYFSKHLEEILITVEWQRFLIDSPTQANELYIKTIKTCYKKIS